MFFDNLQLTHVQGHLLQEDTYYPFGMGIVALSSKAFNGLQNGYKYNGIVEEDNFDLDLYDAYYRTLDPQLGRWWQTDPYNQFASPYLSMGNNPANYTDPGGGFLFDGWGQFISSSIGFFGGAAAGYFIAKNNGGNPATGALFGAIGGGTAGYFGYGLAASVNWGNVAGTLGNAGRWIGGLFQGHNYWIMYNGLRVIIYSGHYGNSSKSKIVKSYPGTSGGEGFQNSNNQDIPKVGPVPEGDYSIDLRPDFRRKAKVFSSGKHEGETKPDIGVDLLPWGNGYLYSGWGQWRARLQKRRVNSTRDFFISTTPIKGIPMGVLRQVQICIMICHITKKEGKILLRLKYNTHQILLHMEVQSNILHPGGMGSQY